MNTLSRLEGGFLGLLIGDALGVPYEFHPAESLPSRDSIEMEPPSGFRRSHARVPPGTYSDDGAQALALLDSLLSNDGYREEDFAARLVDWFERGAYAVDHDVFDVGVQTGTALRGIASGLSVVAAAPRGERANGNGSLMRVLPVALFHHAKGSLDAALIRDAMAQSRTTHAHLRSQIACAVYVLWARRTLEDHPEPWDAAVDAFRSAFPNGSPEHAELDAHVLRDESSSAPNGGGYVIDCLHSARYACDRGDSFESIVKGAIALGDDTDTTACVAGGIAGLRHGVDAIPSRWKNALRGRETWGPLAKRLGVLVSD